MIKALISENGTINTIRFIAIVGYLAFLALSGYLCVTEKQFDYYSEFAALTAGSGTIAALVNRYVNSRLNSAPGEMPRE